MAAFGHLVAVLSLCLLVAVANSQDPPQPPSLENEICLHYTQGGSYLLDLSGTFEMLRIEFYKHIQTMDPRQTEECINEVDADHDRHLNMPECVKLIQKMHGYIRRP